MLKRDKKRLTIVAVFSLIVLLLLASLFFLLIPDPSCRDRKKNQGEEGIDCGGPCTPCVREPSLSDLEIHTADWVHYIDDQYDALVRIENPNDFYGISNFNIVINFKSESNDILFTQTVRENYILPGEVKDFVFQGLKVIETPKKMEAIIDEESISWERLDDYTEPNFIVNKKQYSLEGPDSIAHSAVSGELINQSRVGFQEVTVKALLYDKNGYLVAVNSQIMNSFREDEIRAFKMLFFQDFPGEVAKTVIQTETNLFDDENLMIY